MRRMNLETDFNYRNLTLKDDYEGAVSACFISAKENQGGRAAALYLHGFVDYFFHPHVAAQFLAHDIDFYALDLRKYGRVLDGHPHPNYCRDIHEYFEEIDLAIECICEQGEVPLYLLGHSTGGLISSLYAAQGQKRACIRALLLNSPFFEFNLSRPIRLALPLMAKLVGAIFPYASAPAALPPFYARSLHQDYDGEWAFNLAWKPLQGFPAYFRWLSAISRAHHQLRQEVRLTIPVLVMHSSHSFLPEEYGPEVKTADIILNVEDIKRIGRQLGNRVQLLEVEDAMHDIFLSAKNVRERAFSDLFDWLAQH